MGLATCRSTLSAAETEHAYQADLSDDVADWTADVDDAHLDAAWTSLPSRRLRCGRLHRPPGTCSAGARHAGANHGGGTPTCTRRQPNTAACSACTTMAVHRRTAPDYATTVNTGNCARPWTDTRQPGRMRARARLATAGHRHGQRLPTPVHRCAPSCQRRQPPSQPCAGAAPDPGGMRRAAPDQAGQRRPDGRSHGVAQSLVVRRDRPNRLAGVGRGGPHQQRSGATDCAPSCTPKARTTP